MSPDWISHPQRLLWAWRDEHGWPGMDSRERLTRADKVSRTELAEHNARELARRELLAAGCPQQMIRPVLEESEWYVTDDGNLRVGWRAHPTAGYYAKEQARAVR